MFVYFLNNPVIYEDSRGEDACLVIDDEGALDNGHIGFLVEDDEGNWWHFYWGPKYPILSVIPVDWIPACWFVKYEGDITLDEINTAGQYGATYDRMIYLSGDFSDCVDITKEYTDGGTKYNLYTNNCSQLSLSTLSQAPTKYQKLLQKGSKYLIPKNAYGYMEKNYRYVYPSGGGGGKNQFTINMLY